MKKMVIADIEEKRYIWLMITFKSETELKDIEAIRKEVVENDDHYTTEDLLDKINEKHPILEVDELTNYETLYF